MKYTLLIIISIFVIFSGCFMPVEYRYKLDCITGDLVISYHDLRSDATTDSSILNDWTELKKMAAAKDTAYDTNVIIMISQSIFQEDSVLSGKRTYKVKCPNCFPSKKALLQKILHIEDNGNPTLYEINDEIFIFLDDTYKFVYSNGKVMETSESSISVWPVHDMIFEFAYRLKTDTFKKSLLPYYLKEKSKKSTKIKKR